MAQYELDLRDYGRILIKRKKEILFATILVGFLTFLLTPTPKPIYNAKSSVRVTQSSDMTGLFVQAISYSKWNNLETQAKIITSLNVVTEAAMRLGYIDSTLTLSEIVRSKEDIDKINELTKRIMTEQSGKTDIIDIVTTADNEEEAKAFANHLADAFIIYSINQKNAHVDEATNFILDQLANFKVNLENSEMKIEDFKRKNMAEISLESNKIVSLQEEYEILTGDITSLSRQMEQLELRLASPNNSFIDWVSDVESNPGLNELNIKLVNLQLQKEKLLIYQTTSSPEVIELEEQIQSIIKDLLKEFRGKLTQLKNRLVIVEDRLQNLPGNDLKYSRLARDLTVNEEIYSLLNQKYQEAKIKQAEKIKEMSVVEYATYAIETIEGGKWSKTVLGLVIGLLLGLVVAFIMETLDTSIGAIQDVEEFLKTTVLGVIPHFDKDQIRAKIIKNNPQAANDPYMDFHSELVAQFSPKSPIAESYRTLATNIDFARLRHAGANEFIVTSATMQEGKSTTIVNLAIALAQIGHRTIIVGCNLRRPSLYKVFGLEISPGVKDICLGLTDWKSCVKNINDVALGKMSVTEELLRDGAWSRLSIITCGGVYHNPSEILSTPKMRNFLTELKDEFDIILIDCPPILPVTDAAILGSKVDGAILVYQVGKVARGALKRAKSHLEAVNANVWGVVLNDFKAEIAGFGADTSYYGKYYGAGADQMYKSTVEKVMDKVSVSNVLNITDKTLMKARLFFNKKKIPTVPVIPEDMEEEVEAYDTIDDTEPAEEVIIEEKTSSFQPDDKDFRNSLSNLSDLEDEDDDDEDDANGETEDGGEKPPESA